MGNRRNELLNLERWCIGNFKMVIMGAKRPKSLCRCTTSRTPVIYKHLIFPIFVDFI